MEAIDEIIFQIETLKEDKGNIYITDDIIEQYIIDNMKILISEISKEVN